MALLETIALRRHNYTIGRALATGAVAIPFAIGWTIGVIFRILFAAGAWIWAATVEGFNSGRGKRHQT